MQTNRSSSCLRRCIAIWKSLDKNSGIWVLGLACVTFLSAFFGTWIHSTTSSPTAENWLKANVNRLTDSFYEAGQALILNMEPHAASSNSLIDLSRVTAVLLVAFVAIKTIGRLFRESMISARLRFGAKHSAFIGGLGRIGYQLTIDYLTAGRSVVVQELTSPNHWTRLAEEEGAIIVEGDVADINNLRDFIVRDPSIIHLVTGSDLANINALANVRAIRREHPQLKAATCYVHIDDPGLQRTLNRCLIETACGGDDSLKVHVFNIFHETSVQLIIEKLTRIRPRKHEVALYVIFGFEKMGQAMVKELAEYAHFENQKRSRILVLTKNATAACDHALSQWNCISPRFIHKSLAGVHFDEKCDAWTSQAARPEGVIELVDPKAVEYAANIHFCELVGNADLSLGDVSQLVRLATEKSVRPVFLFCNDEDESNFKIASEFNDALQDMHGINQSLGPDKTVTDEEEKKLRQRHKELHLPVFVFLPQSRPLREILLASTEKYPIVPFGDVSEGLERAHDDIVELVAMDIAAAYDESRKQEAVREADINNSIASKHPSSIVGSPQLPSPRREDYAAEWRKKSFWDRQSNLTAAEHAWIKLQLIGYKMSRVPVRNGNQSTPTVNFDAISIEDKAMLALVEHNRWMAERLLLGWSYGEKSIQPPRRSSLCPKNVLARDELVKDYEQIRSVFQHLQQRGYRMERITEPGEG